MNQCICDICRENIANHRFKVKRKNFRIGNGKWEKIDICDSCYHKMLRCTGKEEYCGWNIKENEE